jgi:branched-chain amino acid transport system substrate-binding protein
MRKSKVSVLGRYGSIQLRRRSRVMIQTRKIVVGLVLLFAAALVWSGGQGESPEPASDLSPDAIRIGVLAPTSGAFAGLGEDGITGVRMALDEVGYSVAGRPVALFVEDTQITADVAVEKARALVNRDDASVVVGPLSGGTTAAVKRAAFEWPDTTFLVNGASNEVTMGDIAPNVYRISFAAGQPMYALAEWAYDNGIRRVATIGEDYAFPWDQVGGFAMVFGSLGGVIPEAYWTPIGTADYSSIIVDLDPNEIDAILVTYGGSNAINFVRQLDEFGLIGQIRILGGSSFMDATVLAEVGHLLDGVVSGSLYSGDIDNPEFREFDEEFRRRTGRASSLFAENYYTSTKWALAATEAVDGNIEDVDAWRAALEEITLKAPRGTVSLDENHNVTGPMYLNRVVEEGGEYRNRIFETIPDVDQYWTFTEEEWEAALPFGRETPTQLAPER